MDLVLVARRPGPLAALADRLPVQTLTLQAFSTRLREQIDLDTLSGELVAVVGQTMEPTQASLWLRPPPPGSSGTAPREPRPTQWVY